MYSATISREQSTVRGQKQPLGRGHHPRHPFNKRHHIRHLRTDVVHQREGKARRNDGQTDPLSWMTITSIAIGNVKCARPSRQTAGRADNTSVKFCGNRREKFAGQLFSGRTRKFCSPRQRPSPSSKCAS